jgi:exopolyphosphatase/guanosine-5'-triphosphate,3'-diphosphate pyrophosphatase
VRVAVVDIGTNSTRLLVADVDGAAGVAELDRRSIVTRLGQGVDATGALADEAVDRVLAVLAEYAAAIEQHGAQRTVAVLTSAVRDAANGPGFARRVRDDFGFDARTIAGDEEARLTFLGATSERPEAAAWPVVVVDIGGGSTELVVDRAHVSLTMGSVRFTERFLHEDPPTRSELDGCASVVRAVLTDGVGFGAEAAIGVAGTVTTLAALDLRLERYDRSRVRGHRLTREGARAQLERLAALPLADRREVPALEPERAPVIVAGAIILIETLGHFGLDAIVVSEHDILDGIALAAAELPPREEGAAPPSAFTCC